MRSISTLAVLKTNVREAFIRQAAKSPPCGNHIFAKFVLILAEGRKSRIDLPGNGGGMVVVFSGQCAYFLCVQADVHAHTQVHACTDCVPVHAWKEARQTPLCCSFPQWSLNGLCDVVKLCYQHVSLKSMFSSTLGWRRCF